MENCNGVLYNARCVESCPENTAAYQGKCVSSCGYFKMMKDGACEYSFPLWLVAALTALCGALIISLIVVVIVWRVREAK